MSRKSGTSESTSSGRASPVRAITYLVERHLLRRSALVARGDRFGLRLRFRTEDVVGRHIYKRGVHQEALTRFVAGVAREVRPGDVIFDVGAHIGWFSLVLDRLTPEDVRIYACEPDPANHAFLRENIETNGASKVTPLEVALSDREGIARLHRYHAKNLGRHSLLPLRRGEGEVEVRTTTLDRLREHEGVADRPVALVKIDVEGYEEFVLAGAQETLEDCRVVVQEHCPGILARAGIDPAPPLRRMVEAGFEPHRLEADGATPASLEEILEAPDSLEVIWQRPRDGGAAR